MFWLWVLKNRVYDGRDIPKDKSYDAESGAGNLIILKNKEEGDDK